MSFQFKVRKYSLQKIKASVRLCVFFNVPPSLPPSKPGKQGNPVVDILLQQIETFYPLMSGLQRCCLSTRKSPRSLASWVTLLWSFRTDVECHILNVCKRVESNPLIKDLLSAMHLIFIELVTLPLKTGFMIYFMNNSNKKNHTKLKALRIMPCNIGNVQNINNISKKHY